MIDLSATGFHSQLIVSIATNRQDIKRKKYKVRKLCFNVIKMN